MEKFRSCITKLLGSQGGEYEEKMLVYLRACFDPLFDSPFRMTRKYVAALVEMAKNMKTVMLKKDGGMVPVREGLVFMNRLQFGFYSVLARLDVEVDYAAIEKQFLDAAGIP
jgi:hypothetical protein